MTSVVWATATLLGGLAAGCGTSSALNPAFINSISGGIVPVTPGPGAAFVMVRGKNETNQTVEFIVTIRRSVPVTDDAGSIQFDDDSSIITRPESETRRLITLPTGQARDLGTLFPCGDTPVTHVGLGENLLPTDAAVFVGGGGTGLSTGFGIPAGSLNPLQLMEGNFNCGDTIIFRAFVSNAVAGGIGLQSFLLPGSEQPSIFDGPDTFVNLNAFIESQERDTQP